MKIVTALFVLALFSCNQRQPDVQGDQPDSKAGWITGTEQEQIKTIEKHLRGFDMAMVETGYRYQELYRAGKDENWEYAAYQSGKIRVAIENGLERRPKRAVSAQNFLNIALPQMDSAIASRDTMQFRQAFDVLTANCMACHALEKVSYVTIKTPVERQSPVRK